MGGSFNLLFSRVMLIGNCLYTHFLFQRCISTTERYLVLIVPFIAFFLAGHGTNSHQTFHYEVPPVTSSGAPQ